MLTTPSNHAFDAANRELPHWYAIHTRSCQEKRVAEHLHARNIAHFLPTYRSERRWNNRCRVTLERPLFPGYVFIQIRLSERIRVLELSGVVAIVGTGRRPTALPGEDIERLRSGLHLVTAEPHPVLTIGTQVRICNGPLEGLCGIVAQKKNGFRVVLTIDVIMKSVAVEVSESDVEQLTKPSVLAVRGEMAVA